MKKAKYSIVIDADKKTVWDTMLNDKTYREWTRAFHDGSYYEGSWEKGSEIRFMAPNDEGKMEGMFSRIKENDKYKFVSIEHLGMIKDGVVDTTSEEVKKWTPSFENYTFTEKDGKTEVKIEMDVAEEYESMFEEMWPKALKALKTLSEKSAVKAY